jgi:sortase A
MNHLRFVLKIIAPILIAGVCLVIASLFMAPRLAPYAETYYGAIADPASEDVLFPEYNDRDERVQAFLKSLTEKESLPVYTDLPVFGDQYATIRIGGVGIDAPIFLGDTPELLQAGVGTYAEGGLPGQGRTILMGGHNNTDFLTLPKAEIGDVIEIDANYGQFRYKITDAKELRYDDPAALDLDAPEENLVLYTCTRSIPGGATPWRWFVYGQPIEDEGHD